MRKPLSAICAAVVIAAGSAAAITPVAAQPARIIVRGATPIYVPPLTHDSYNTSTILQSPTNLGYDDPFGFYYDAPGKVPDYRYYGSPAVDLTLTATLNRTNQSIMGHIQACQARYPTYSAASNTYYGPGGIPVPCY